MSFPSLRGRMLRLPATTWLPLAAGLVALAIGCYQLSLPHVLGGVLGYNEGYDDGVYLGAAIRFVHGVLPYRDFVFVDPPGIVYLMTPVALLGLITGSHGALIVARILTVIVVAANPVVAGRLVRSAGRAAVAVTSFALALWPLVVSVDRTLELEPYLVLCCLLGALLVLGGDGDPSPRRLLIGGAVLGFAFVVKAWAVLLIVGALLVWLPRWRRGGRWLVSGILVGALVPSLPFLVAAPHAFWHDAIVAQLHRQKTPAATPLGQRMLLIAGVSSLPAVTVPTGAAYAIFGVLVMAIVGVYGVGHRQRSGLEWFVLAAATLTFLGMFDVTVLYDQNAYFPAAMLAPLLGVCVGRIVSAVMSSLRARPSRTPKHLRGAHRRSPNTSQRVVAAVGVPVALGLVAFLVSQDSTYAASYLSEASDPSALAAYIPPGACVISDFPADLVVAERFTPAHAGCPAVVDPYGLYVADDNGSQPHPSPPFAVSFVDEWFTWLQHADYVELRIPFSDFIPWVPYMITWFNDNYHLVVHLAEIYPHPFVDTRKDIYLYERNAAHDSR